MLAERGSLRSGLSVEEGRDGLWTLTSLAVWDLLVTTFGMMDKVMPPEASEHFRNAGREQLLGIRSIVDFWIRRLDEADSRAAGRSRDRETIEIEEVDG
jgi:hypothetical protein